MSVILTSTFQDLPSTFQGRPISPDRPSGPFIIKGAKAFIVPSKNGYELSTAKELGIPKSILGSNLTDQQQLRLASKHKTGLNLIVTSEGKLTSLTVTLINNRAHLKSSLTLADHEVQILKSSVALQLAQTNSTTEFKNKALEYRTAYVYLRKNDLFTDVQKKYITEHYKRLKQQVDLEKSSLKAAVGEDKNSVKVSDKTLSDHSFVNGQRDQRNQKIETTVDQEIPERKEKKRERVLTKKRSANLGGR